MSDLFISPFGPRFARASIETIGNKQSRLPRSLHSARCASIGTIGNKQSRLPRWKPAGLSRGVQTLFLASLIFSLLSFLLYVNIQSLTPHQDIDSKAYLHHASEIATHGHVTGTQPPYYALGYAFFIGCLYRVFGASPVVIILAQLILSLLSFFLIMRITRTIFGHRASYISAFLCAFNLGYLVFTQFILTEILLSFFLLLFFERMTARNFWCAGLALGVSVIVKPAALYFVFPVFIFLLFDTRALAFALCFYAPIFMYMTHNKIMFNTFSVSSLGPVNLYGWFLPNIMAAEHGTTSDHERSVLHQCFLRDAGFSKHCALLKHYIVHKPLLVVQVWLKNMFKTAAGLYTTNLKVLVESKTSGGDISFFRMSGNMFQKGFNYIRAGTTHSWVIVVGVAEAAWSVARYVLCLIGLLWLCVRKQWDYAVLSALYLLYFFAITGHDGCARFRMMSEGILIVLAAGGLDLCLKKEKL